MKKLFYFLISVIAVGFLLLNSCQHTPEAFVPDDNNGNNPDPPIDTLLCDSSNVTYPGIVYPILETYCISCHSAPTPAGALDFNDFGDVAFVAQSGQLLGSIKHEPEYSPMPEGGNKYLIVRFL